jgi:hypothetical protein
MIVPSHAECNQETKFYLFSYLLDNFKIQLLERSQFFGMR